MDRAAQQRAERVWEVVRRLVRDDRDIDVVLPSVAAVVGLDRVPIRRALEQCERKMRDVADRRAAVLRAVLDDGRPRPPIVIDLDRLAGTPDAQPLAYFLDRIVEQRGEQGRQLVLRRRDLGTIRELLGLDEAALADRLAAWGSPADPRPN